MSHSFQDQHKEISTKQSRQNLLMHAKLSRADRRNVICHQAGIVPTTIVDSISIVRRLPTTQSITPLPEKIRGNGAYSG
jgi:hypothetical protein